MAARVGGLFEASKAPVALRKAKALIVEFVERGSRAAPALGEGTRPDRTRVYLYASAEVDSKMATARLAQYVDRSGIELAGVDTRLAEIGEVQGGQRRGVTPQHSTDLPWVDRRITLHR